MEGYVHSLVSKTALQGKSRSKHDELARSLGYFSLALGVAELLAPRAICHAIGLKGLEGVVRAYGAREVATGVAILASHDPAPWIWARVAGDLADIATVATGAQPDNPKRENAVLTLAALAAVTLVDVACASRMTGEKGNRKTAIADYSDRSGFPQGLSAARGAARDYQVPDDMRVPELLRADTFERRKRGTRKST
jgi:hypothetical protein